ncbi:MAG: hypothetical protein ACI4II_00310 [Acutalibacteraceae bacterium]
MKTKNKIAWGIILILVAVTLILFAAFPGFMLADIAAWKIIAAVILGYWLIDNLIFGDTLAEHFDIFLPVALGLIVFEKEIATALNKPEDLFSNWIIFISAILLTIAVHLLFGKKCVRKDGWQKNNLSAGIFYLDASSGENLKVENKFGAAEVYFKNVNESDADMPVHLEVNNSLGAMSIHVPEDWFIESDIVNSMGAIDIRENVIVNGRKLIVTGENKKGAIEFK